MICSERFSHGMTFPPVKSQDFFSSQIIGFWGLSFGERHKLDWVISLCFWPWCVRKRVLRDSKNRNEWAREKHDRWHMPAVRAHACISSSLKDRVCLVKSGWNTHLQSWRGKNREGCQLAAQGQECVDVGGGVTPRPPVIVLFKVRGMSGELEVTCLLHELLVHFGTSWRYHLPLSCLFISWIKASNHPFSRASHGSTNPCS